MYRTHHEQQSELGVRRLTPWLPQQLLYDSDMVIERRRCQLHQCMDCNIHLRIHSCTRSMMSSQHRRHSPHVGNHSMLQTRVCALATCVCCSVSLSMKPCRIIRSSSLHTLHGQARTCFTVIGSEKCYYCSCELLEQSQHVDWIRILRIASVLQGG